MNELLAQQMRTGMRRLVAGISIITTADAKGQRLAMTASSVTSVSDDPASLLVCIHQSSWLANAIMERKHFCVNLLAQRHNEISVRCASADKSLDRFALGEWLPHDTTGLYYLKDALAVFHCHNTTALEYGTHFIFVGDIDSVTLQGDTIDPLAYLNGEYVRLAN